MTTKADLEEWFDQGVKKGATHLVVVCDTFDYDDYPVFVKPGEDVNQVVSTYRGKQMSQVMEVYNLSKPKDSQMQELRSWNL